MNKSITDFVEDYVEGEPLTPKNVGSLIKKYIHMNYEPSKQVKLDLYEELLFKIAEDVENGSENVKKYITNIRNWSHARTHTNVEASQAEQVCLENETFYNLLKI